MRRVLMLAVMLAAAVGCKKKDVVVERPDSTVVVGDTLDSVGTDSVLLDQADADTFGLPPEPDDEVLDSLLALPRSRLRSASSISGLTYGLTGVTPGMMCNWPLNGNMLSITPDNVQNTLKVAKQCNTRIVIVPARRLITTTGENHSPLSMSRAKSITAAIANKLNASFLDTYGRYLIGYNLADDYGSSAQWGGKIVTQAEVAEWATYARGVFNSRVAIGVRVEPQWILKGSSSTISTLKSKLDYTWCQYRTTKGNFNDYVNRCATQSSGLGLKTVMGINVRYIGKEGGPVATPTQVKTYLVPMVKNAKNCASLSWKWDTDGSTWTSPLRTAHLEVAAIAKAQPMRSCRKGINLATDDSLPSDSTPGDTAVVVVDSTRDTQAVVAAESAGKSGHTRKPHP